MAERNSLGTAGVASVGRETYAVHRLAGRSRPPSDPTAPREADHHRHGGALPYVLRPAPGR